MMRLNLSVILFMRRENFYLFVDTKLKGARHYTKEKSSAYVTNSMRIDLKVCVCATIVKNGGVVF